MYNHVKVQLLHALTALARHCRGVIGTRPWTPLNQWRPHNALRLLGPAHLVVGFDGYMFAPRWIPSDLKTKAVLRVMMRHPTVAATQRGIKPHNGTENHRLVAASLCDERKEADEWPPAMFQPTRWCT